ncbi:MAG: response regulator, partial [Planctomycetaceae bacterium]
MKLRALVVEDDPKIIHLIAEAMVSMGHDYDIVSSQEEAVTRMSENDYSYILLDLGIPVSAQAGTPRIQNTENLLERICEMKDKLLPPIIIMSDHEVAGLKATIDIMRLAMSLSRKGAIDIIAKPFPTAGRTIDRVIKKVLRITAGRCRRELESRLQPPTTTKQSSDEA